MTDNKTFWTFELYDKVSSVIVNINKNLGGLHASFAKVDAYIQDVGSRFVRFNAIADAVSNLILNNRLPILARSQVLPGKNWIFYQNQPGKLANQQV